MLQIADSQNHKTITRIKHHSIQPAGHLTGTHTWAHEFSGGMQDGELRKAFQRTLGKQGLKFKLNTKVKEAKTEGNVVKLKVEPSKGGDEEILEADIVLLSAGAL